MVMIDKYTLAIFQNWQQKGNLCTQWFKGGQTQSDQSNKIKVGSTNWISFKPDARYPRCHNMARKGDSCQSSIPWTVQHHRSLKMSQTSLSQH